MWFVELCAWVLGYLWDSISLVGLALAAVCATLGYFVVGLKGDQKLQSASEREEDDNHDMAAPRRRDENHFALLGQLGDEDNEITPEEADEELQKAYRLSRESFEKEKKSRAKNRAENRYGAASAGDFAIPSCEEFSQMSLDDRVRIVRNLAEVNEGDGDGDGHEVLHDLPPEERPKLLAEMGKRKVVAAKLASRRAGHGEDPFLPPPAMPPPRTAGARGAAGGAAEGASSVPRDDEEEELQLALALSRSEAQTRGSTPAATRPTPTPPTTPQRHQQQQQPRLSDQDDEEFQRALRESLNPENSLTLKEYEEQQMKKAVEQSAREALEEDMAARAASKKVLRVPGSLRPIVIDGMNVAFAHGNDQKFSAQGLMIAFDYFRNNGWEIENIKIFVKRNKRFHEAAKEDKDLCETMNKASIVVWPMGNYDDV